jgi:translation initiation factor 2 beta subunit (eIF-2beta)/eIF-5
MTRIAPAFLNWKSASEHINETSELQESGIRLNLDEIQNFLNTLKSCPDCGSTEGFWLVAKHDNTYLQCKHCAAILEICKIHPSSKTTKDSKKFLEKLKM